MAATYHQCGSSLAVSLYENAHWTWGQRETAKRLGFPFGEETITETILLHLAKHNSSSVVVVPFTKHEEARTGSDWEWCFYNAAQSKFLPMLVQAKVLDNNDGEYSHVDRSIGNTGVKQIDRLLKTARSRSVPALYAFYNHVRSTRRLNLSACGCHHCEKCWGCTIALAEDVYHSLPDKSFSTISKFSMPWVCLVCNGGISGEPPSLNGISLALKRLKSFALGESAFADFGSLFEPRAQAPEYFSALRTFVEAPEEAGDGLRERIVEKLRAANPGIDGVMLIQGQD